MKSQLWFSGVLAVLLTPAGATYGQAVNGTLLGTITDGTGASAPNAKVTITEVNTSISRTANTNESGYYAFPDLPPGTYDVSVELQGFKRAVRTQVSVLVNSTIRVELTLQPGELSESITVAG